MITNKCWLHTLAKENYSCRWVRLSLPDNRRICPYHKYLLYCLLGNNAPTKSISFHVKTWRQHFSSEYIIPKSKTICIQWLDNRCYLQLECYEKIVITTDPSHEWWRYNSDKWREKWNACGICKKKKCSRQFAVREKDNQFHISSSNTQESCASKLILLRQYWTTL